MGKRFVEESFDDIDGTVGDTELYAFSILGESYEIDVNAKNATKATRALEGAGKLIVNADAVFDEAVKAAEEVRAATLASVENTLDWLLPKARKIVPKKTAAKRVAKTTNGEDRSDWPKIRAWANANGYTVASLGIIARHVIEAYYNRNQSPVKAVAAAKATTRPKVVTNPFTGAETQPELPMPKAKGTPVKGGKPAKDDAYALVSSFAKSHAVNLHGLSARTVTEEMVQAYSEGDVDTLRGLLGG